MSNGFKVVVMGNGHKVAACLYAQLWLLGEPEPWGKSCFWIVKSGKCQKKHLKLVSHSFFLLYPCPLDTSPFLQHHSGKGAFIHRWGDPKEGGWRWEPQHQETWSPWGFSKLFQPRGSTSFGCSRHSFTAGGPPGSGCCGPLQRGAGMPGPWGRAHWLVHPPQLCQPHDSPSLGTKPAQASGMCQQPRAPRPEGNRVGILFL